MLTDNLFLDILILLFLFIIYFYADWNMKHDNNDIIKFNKKDKKSKRREKHE